MKRQLFLFVFSFFAMVLPVSADEIDSQPITFNEFIDQCGVFLTRPYKITVDDNVMTIIVANFNETNEIMTVYDLSHGNIVLNKKIDADQVLKLKVTIKKGIYLVNFDKVSQKLKVGH